MITSAKVTQNEHNKLLKEFQDLNDSINSETYWKVAVAGSEGVDEDLKIIGGQCGPIWSAEFKMPSRPHRFGLESNSVEKFALILGQYANLVDEYWLQCYKSYFPSISLYGERLLPEDVGGNGGDDFWSDEEKLGSMCNFLPTLLDIVKIVDEMNRLVVQLLRNVCTGTSKTSTNWPPMSIKQTYIDIVISALSLATCITKCVYDNDILQDHWHFFQKVMNSESSFDTAVRKESVRNMILRVNCLLFEQDEAFLVAFKLLSSKDEIVAGLSDKKRLEFVLKQTMLHLRIKPSPYRPNREAIGAFCLLGILNRVAGSLIPDNLAKTIFMFLQSCQIIPVHCLTSFDCLQFCGNHLKHFVDGRRRDLDMLQRNLMALFDDKVARVCTDIEEKITVWEARMESAVADTTSGSDLIRTRLSLYGKGFEYAEESAGFLSLGIGQHLIYEAAMSKSNIPPLINLILAMARVQACSDRDYLFRVENMKSIVTNVVQGVVNIIDGFQRRHEQLLAKKPKDEKIAEALNVFSLLRANLLNISGSGGWLSLRVCRIYLQLLVEMKAVDEGSYNILNSQMYNLNRFFGYLLHSKNHFAIEQILFWNRELIAIYFDYLIKAVEQPNATSVAPYNVSQKVVQLAQVINWMPQFLGNSKHVSSINSLIASLKREIFEHLDVFIGKLSVSVEKHVRLAVHQSITQTQVNPFKLHSMAADSQKSMKQFLTGNQLQPFHILGSIVDLKLEIAAKLSKSFYEMSLVNPRNAKVYEEMKLQCLELYGMYCIPELYRFSSLSYAGESSLSDIRSMFSLIEDLETSFITSFTYSLSRKLFVEKRSQSKFVFSFGVESVSEEILSSGQFLYYKMSEKSSSVLRMLLQRFFDFCYSDYIRTIVSKEFRQLANSSSAAAATNQPYPLTNVSAVKQGFFKFDSIRNDGKHSLTILADTFKSIGLVIALDRMIANSMVRIRSQQCLQMMDGQFESSESTTLPTNVNEIWTRMVAIDRERRKEVNDGLVDDSSNSSSLSSLAIPEHLQNFFVIVPTLIVHYAQESQSYRMNTERERKDENSQVEVFIGDDSLPIGITWVLSKIKQLGSFEGLKMFDFKGVQDLPTDGISDTNLNHGLAKELKQIKSVMDASKIFIQ